MQIPYAEPYKIKMAEPILFGAGAKRKQMATIYAGACKTRGY